MNRKRECAGFTLIELMVVMAIIGTLAGTVIVAIGPIREQFRKFKCKANLEQLHKLMFIYSQNNNDELPSMQRRGSSQGGGIRDLYPLYATATGNKRAILGLLQPPGTELVKFSDDPGPDEFDDKHIAYVYNSLAVLDSPDNVPMLAERGVSDGMLNDNEKPVFKYGAHILMSNGAVEWVTATKGRMSLEKLGIKKEELAKLK